MSAQQSGRFNSEDRVIFSIVAVLLLCLAVVWMSYGRGAVDDTVTDVLVAPAVKDDDVATVIKTPEPSITPETPVASKDEEIAATVEEVSETVEEVPETVGVEVKAETEDQPEVSEDVAENVQEEVVPAQEPRFDLVRVDEGSAMVAGKAAPNSEVRLLADGKEIGQVKTDAIGAFALFADLPTGDAPLNLVLETVGGDIVQSTQQVLVVPSQTDSTQAPKVVIAQADGNVVVQQPVEAAPSVQALSLDTINYSNRGDVVFAGRGSADQSVRVYVDNKPVSLGTVDNGNWKFEVPDIKEGIYTVRVDAVDATGKVVERVESPFQRVITEMDAGAVTIQPGFTLWQLAEIKYGSGDRFVQIFDANRDLIKDPDMIFPGQVFEVPKE